MQGCAGNKWSEKKKERNGQQRNSRGIKAAQKCGELGRAEEWGDLDKEKKSGAERIA